MSLTRRGFLGAGLAVGLSGCGMDLLPGQTGELLRSEAPLPEPFKVPLPIPPVKKPVRSVGGVDHYQVMQHETEVEILPGLKTKIMGYDGIFPGPTFDVRSGRGIVVEHVNMLSVPTSVHLHGGHTPASSDGWPLDLVVPAGGHAPDQHGHTGDTSQVKRSHTYPNTQRAATLWYHDHRMDYTAPQVYRGLFGLHLVRDDEEDALPLPHGNREVPLVIADRAFASDGSFRYPGLKDEAGVEDDYMEGVLGDVILVNGAPWPVLEVDAARYRFRILNASNARRYQLALDPGARIVQIGSDGGLLGAPVEHSSLVIAPAERFDVVIDFSAYEAGSEVTLVNLLGGDGPTNRIMRFKVARKVTDDSTVPAKLSSYEPIEAPKGAIRRGWRFSRGATSNGHGWTVNGRTFDPGRIEARPRLGDYEVWSFVTDVHHPVHVHLAPFQVLTRGGKDPSAYDVGLKDTVDIRPAEVVEVLIRFTEHKGKYLIHCHNLEHEDMAMMAAFETV